MKLLFDYSMKASKSPNGSFGLKCVKKALRASTIYLLSNPDNFLNAQASNSTYTNAKMLSMTIGGRFDTRKMLLSEK